MSFFTIFSVGARSTPLRLDDVSSDEDSPKPVRKVIKPVAAFQVRYDWLTLLRFHIGENTNWHK